MFFIVNIFNILYLVYFLGGIVVGIGLNFRIGFVEKVVVKIVEEIGDLFF